MVLYGSNLGDANVHIGLIGFGASTEAAATRADFTVLVDADTKFQKLKLRKDETAPLEIEVPATAATLTLIATDGGDGIGSDLLFLGDPKLVPATDVSRLSEAEVIELANLRAEVQKLETALKAPRPIQGLRHRHRGESASHPRAAPWQSGG